MFNCKAVIFDLDGVIVDTAKYHYLAWKRLADELGFEFTESDNERLKGVSRLRSLEILLEIGNITIDEETRKQQLAEKKNGWYVEYINKISESDLLPGAKEYILYLKDSGIKVALGSASKNSPIILKKLGIYNLFDVIVDGNSILKAKPDSEVFLNGAELLGFKPEDCLVIEDAQAGIEAAKGAGMKCIGIGIGKRDVLRNADDIFLNLSEVHKKELILNIMEI